MEVKPIYLDGQRFYPVYGRNLISVTTVLAYLPESPVITRWKRKTPNWRQYNEDRMLLGSYLHYIIGHEMAKRFSLPLPEFDPLRPLPDKLIDDLMIMKSYWADFKEWANPRAILVEKFVYNLIIGYAGRLDLILKLDVDGMDAADMLRHPNISLCAPRPNANDVWLVDLKGSSMIDDGKFGGQVTAYRMALISMQYRVVPNRMAILRLGSNGWEFREMRMMPGTLMKAMKLYHKAVAAKKAKKG